MMHPSERPRGMSLPDLPSESVGTGEQGGESDGSGGTPLGIAGCLSSLACWSEDESESATPDLTPPGEGSATVGPLATPPAGIGSGLGNPGDPASQLDGMAAEAQRARGAACDQSLHQLVEGGAEVQGLRRPFSSQAESSGDPSASSSAIEMLPPSASVEPFLSSQIEML